MYETDQGILLLGGGGHAKSVLCALFGMKEYSRIGIVDTVGAGSLLGVPVVGTDDDLPALRARYSKAFISVGSIGDSRQRRRLLERAQALGYAFPNIIDPSGIVS